MYSNQQKKNQLNFFPYMKSNASQMIQKARAWVITLIMGALALCLSFGNQATASMTRAEARQALSDMGIEEDRYRYNLSLYRAAEEGDAETVRLLIAAGADLNMPLPPLSLNLKDIMNNPQGAICVASDRQHWEIVRMLAEAGADVNAAWKDLTPLHCAIAYANTDMVRFLLAHGAKVNRNTSPPLLLAIRVGNVEITKILIEHGADVQYTNTTKYATTGFQYTTMYEATQEKPDATTPLLSAIESGHVEIAELLIESGADVNFTKSWMKDRDTQWVLKTPLEFACDVDEPDPAMIRMLLSHGAKASWGAVWAATFEVPMSVWWQVFLAYPSWWVIMIAALVAIILPTSLFIYSRRN